MYVLSSVDLIFDLFFLSNSVPIESNVSRTGSPGRIVAELDDHNVYSLTVKFDLNRTSSCTRAALTSSGSHCPMTVEVEK